MWKLIQQTIDAVILFYQRIGAYSKVFACCEDVDAMAKACLTLLHSEKTQEAYSENARRKVLEDFNEAFDTTFSDEEFDTIGGLVVRSFGEFPGRGDVTVVDGLEFERDGLRARAELRRDGGD